MTAQASAATLRAAFARPERLAPIAIVLLAVGLYASTLGYELIWDDEVLIERETAAARGTLAGVWSEPFPLGSGGYYRPLVIFTFWLEHALFGLDPRVLHAVQVLLYAACCLAVFALARALANPQADGTARRGLLLPAAAALLFAAHPAHVETVTFVSARTDLLAGVLSVLAVLAAVRAATFEDRRRTAWNALSGLLLFLGLLSKEVAVLIPALSWLAVRAVVPADRRRLRPLFAAHAVALVAYVLLRLVALGSLRGGPELVWGSVTGVLLNFGRCVELLFLPARLRVYHPPIPEGEGLPYVLLGAIALLVLLGFGIALLRRKPLVSFALLWIPITFLPASGIVVLPAAPMAERFLFLPSVGVCLLGAAGLSALLGRRAVVPRLRLVAGATLAVVLVLFGARTVTRTSVYGSELALYGEFVREQPDFYYGYLGLGMHHQKAGRPALAVEPLEQAVRLAATRGEFVERRGEANRWMGLTYLDLGRLQPGIRQLEIALAKRPEDVKTLVNLSRGYLQANRVEEAEEAARKALAVVPDLGQAELNLGIALARKEAHAEALPHFERAAELLPSLPDAHYSLGNGYAMVGRNEEAVASFRRALEIQPRHIHALKNLRIVERRLKPAASD